MREDKNRKNRRKKKKIWKKVLLVILLILILLGGWFAYKTYKNGGGLSGMLATVVGHDENTKKDLKEIKDDSYVITDKAYFLFSSSYNLH